MSRLSAEEMILRVFDNAGEYGPAVGVARTARWKRAVDYKLEPPPAVGAIRFYLDRHLSSIVRFAK